MRFPRPRRLLAGGAVLAVTAVAGWVAAVPGASAAEFPVGAQLATFHCEQVVCQELAIGDAPEWYVGFVDTGILKLRDESGTLLGQETRGTGWVAVNQGSHGRPPGRYLLETSTEPAAPLNEYRMQWINAGLPLNLPSATTTVGEENGDWGIAARTLSLTAGAKVRISVQGNGVGGISVLHGQPRTPASAVQNMAAADEHFVVDKLTPADAFSTFEFEALEAADYLVVFDMGLSNREKTTVITKVTGRPRSAGR